MAWQAWLQQGMLLMESVWGSCGMGLCYAAPRQHSQSCVAKLNIVRLLRPGGWPQSVAAWQSGDLAWVFQQPSVVLSTCMCLSSYSLQVRQAWTVRECWKHLLDTLDFCPLALCA